ncbi:hypothetical protein [Sphingobacterium deserti]|uniref:Lipocalin-like domain-containing protein n=1 Tax=Sphingobacterium deserti TaxID=1229276 RepID=A0A0B8T652_9SPHI|nr:hypothetical protein [Sphingobacterium deserti]KGE12520.1 hypothetical protein DI53_3560 [Sphingobacterium deserti]
MEHRILFILLVIMGAVAVSCKKDSTHADNPIEITKSKILGKWNFESGSIVTTNPPEPAKTEKLTGRPGMVYEFRTNGIAFNNLEGDDEEPYVITSASVIEIDEVMYTIKELTETNFVFESVYKNGNSTTTFNLILNR